MSRDNPSLAMEHCPMCRASDWVAVPGPKRSWTYLRCTRCGHQLLFPMPTDLDLSAFYNSRYRVPLDAYLQGARREFPRVSDFIGRWRTGRMLEVGCSYGEMLWLFSSAGWDVEGVELDARAASYAREQRGLRVHAGTLEEVRDVLTPGYDVIAAYHVVEHIPEPARFFGLLVPLLRPGGCLVLKTPNGASVAARAAHGWWQWASPPEHIHLFTPRSIATLLAGVGLAVDRCITRRGDARGTLAECTRAFIRRAVPGLATYRGSTAPARRRAPASRLARRISESAMDFVGRPIDWLIDAAGSQGRPIGAEILLLARRV